jgi:hypothetical protein
LANRYACINGSYLPILHLGLGNLERFRSAISPLEELYKLFVDSELPLLDFLEVYKVEVRSILLDTLPRCGALSLNTSLENAVNFKNPLALLNATLQQWVHNFEIGRIRKLFPHPDDEEKQREPDPSDDNPECLIERLQSAYHCSRSEALETTVPQVYLKGQSSAWAYKKAKDESSSGSESSHGTEDEIFFEGRKWKSFDEMGPDRAGRYSQQHLGT